jgi:hypothetical protein
MAQVALQQHGTWLVEGTGRDVFHLPDGRRVTGQDLRTWPNWPWRDCLGLPGIRYARVTATSPTDGPVTVVIVEEAGAARDDLLCHATTLTALRLIQAWKRRSWIAHHFRTLKHLLATEACQVQGEDAYYGHLVLRLLAGLVWLYTARILYKGRVTMEASGFSLKHYWRFLDSERLELHRLSWGLPVEAACMLVRIVERKSQFITTALLRKFHNSDVGAVYKLTKT